MLGQKNTKTALSFNFQNLNSLTGKLFSARLFFYICCQVGSPSAKKKGLSDLDAESVFFAPKLYVDTASGQKSA